MESLAQFLPLDAVKIGLALLLSFLIGLEREEHKGEAGARFFFGGVRTYPLICFLGFAFAKLSGDNLMPVAIGFATVGAFLLLVFWKKLNDTGAAGVTSELSGLVVYVVGALVCKENYWTATTVTVLCLFLLQLKEFLERLSTQIKREEIYTFTKFLLLAAVLLPIIPNKDFTEFNLNPFKTWLVVVIISTVSYAAFVADKFIGKKGGVLASAIFGGAYSSTITSLVIARRSKAEDLPRLFSGSILMASGMMYIRLLILLALLSFEVAEKLLPGFLALGLVALICGFFWARSENGKSDNQKEVTSRNPLEISSAILFAVLFLVMGVASRFVQSYWGSSGVYGLSFLSGLADVDPFIMSIAQSAGKQMTVEVVAQAIGIATVSNNIVKAFYVYSAGKGKTRILSVAFLLILALLGVVAILATAAL